MEQAVHDQIVSFRNFLTSVNLSTVINGKEEFHFLSYRDANSYLLDSEVEAEVLAWTLRILEEGKCPGALASALANAVLLRLKESDLRDVRRNNQNAEGATLQELEPIKLFTKVTHCVEDVLEEWQNVSDSVLADIAKEVEAVSVFAIKNGRRKMEDRHVVIPDLNRLFGIESEPRTSFYAVFDGHAGTDAAVYSTVHLHCNIVNHPSYLNDLPVAIKEGFSKTDLDFVAKSNREELKSGSTALACLLRGKQLHLAWLGDSQAILVRGGKPVYNMIPHKPDRDDEKLRIENAGGCVVFFGTWRVNGTLAVSRAIGDVDYKPYVCSDADIETISLDGSEDFVVLACDGLWDVLQADDVVNLVYSYLAKQPGDANSVAAHLVQTAKERRSSDNITVIVVFLRDVAEWPLEEILARQTSGASNSAMDTASVSTVDDAIEETNGVHHMDSQFDDCHPALRAFHQLHPEMESPTAANEFSNSDSPFGNNTDFSGTADSDAANAPNFSNQFVSSWEDESTVAVEPLPVLSSKLDSSAPEFIPSDKTGGHLNNPFGIPEVSSGLVDFESPDLFAHQPSSTSHFSPQGDNPFLQSSSELVESVATDGAALFDFNFSEGSADDVNQQLQNPSPVTRPSDFVEHLVIDHEALLQSTLSPDAQPFVMSGKCASPLAGSDHSPSSPHMNVGDQDFMLPSLQPVQLMPTAPPAELTPRTEEVDINFVQSDHVLDDTTTTTEQPANLFGDQFSSGEDYHPRSTSPEERQSETPHIQEIQASLSTSPFSEERSSLPASPVPTPAYQESPVPTSDYQESPVPTSDYQEDQHSQPTSPEPRPSLPTSPYLEEQSSMTHGEHSSNPSSPIQKEGSSIPSSPSHQDFIPSSTSPLMEEQHHLPTLHQDNPFAEQSNPFAEQSNNEDDYDQLNVERNETAFEAFLGKRSEVAEARPDSQSEYFLEPQQQNDAGEQDKNAVLDFDCLPESESGRDEQKVNPAEMADYLPFTEPRQADSQWVTERLHTETQFTESLVKDDLHTVFTAGESTMTFSSPERENSSGALLDLLAHQKEFVDATSISDSATAVAGVSSEQEECFSLETEQQETGFQSSIQNLAPAEVSVTGSESGALLDNIPDTALVADDVEDADSEDDVEWRFYATNNATEVKPDQAATSVVEAPLLISDEPVVDLAAEQVASSVLSVDLIPKSDLSEDQSVLLPTVAAGTAVAIAAASSAAVAAPSKPVAAKRSDPPKTNAATTKAPAKAKSAPVASTRPAAPVKPAAGKPLSATSSAAAVKTKPKSSTAAAPVKSASSAKPSEASQKKVAALPPVRKASEPLKVSGTAATTSTAPSKISKQPATSSTTSAKVPSRPVAPARSTSAPTTAVAKKPATSVATKPPATRRAVTATVTNGSSKSSEGGAVAPARKPIPITKPASTGAAKNDGPLKIDIKQTKETTNKQISGITKRTVSVSKTTSTSTVKSSSATTKTVSARPAPTTTNGISSKLTTTTTAAKVIPPKTTKSATATQVYGANRTTSTTTTSTTTTATAATKTNVIKSPVKSMSEASPAAKLGRVSTPKSASPNKAASMLSNGRKAPASKTPTHSGSTQKVAVTRLNKAAAVAATNEEGEKGILDAVAKEALVLPPTSHDNITNGNNVNDDSKISAVHTADGSASLHQEEYATNGTNYHSGINGSCPEDVGLNNGDGFLA